MQKIQEYIHLRVNTSISNILKNGRTVALNGNYAFKSNRFILFVAASSNPINTIAVLYHYKSMCSISCTFHHNTGCLQI